MIQQKISRLFHVPMNHQGVSLLLTAAFLPLILLSYLYLDEQTARWAISNDKSIFYNIAEFIGLFGNATYPLVVSAVLWLVWKFYRKSEALAARAGFFFVSVVITGVSVNLVKCFFGKARPMSLKNDNEFGFTWFALPNDHNHLSFPSGHTTTSFTIATALTLIFPKWWPAFYGYAVTVAFSRIGTWDHYPSDVFAGALFGTVLTLILFHWEKISFKHAS